MTNRPIDHLPFSLYTPKRSAKSTLSHLKRGVLHETTCFNPTGNGAGYCVWLDSSDADPDPDGNSTAANQYFNCRPDGNARSTNQYTATHRDQYTNTNSGRS
jgi:hypothetical protein